MMFFFPRRMSTALIATLGCLLLTGCFMIPGKFNAKLDLRSDGTFTYTYDGEIRLLGMTQLVEMSKNRTGSPEWDPDAQVCWGPEPENSANEAVEQEADQTSVKQSSDIKPVTITLTEVEIAAENDSDFESRACTDQELVEKRAEFDEQQVYRKERNEREAKQMQAVFGGIDPSDPDAGKKIAERLTRQYGWNKAEYLGDGLFDVDFSVTSQINHDFSFPTMEGLAAGQPFLYVYRRAGDTVRIEAPGFAHGGGQTGAAGGSLNWLLMMEASEGGTQSGTQAAEMFKDVSGTFTITTDGEILANNTDEGYRDVAEGRALVWKIDSVSIQNGPPSALIKLKR